MTIDEQLTYLRKGMAEIIREEHLRERLIESCQNGPQTQGQSRLRPPRRTCIGPHGSAAQDETLPGPGPHGIFLIGDMTGMIGDPTGRNVTRPSDDHRGHRAQRRDLQAAGLQNSSTLKRRSPLQQPLAGAAEVEDVIRLTASTRWRACWNGDDFAKRYASNAPISIARIDVPAAQGYDSVALQSDVEMGARTRNSTCWWGANAARLWPSRPQIVARCRFSKAWTRQQDVQIAGNYIGITEPPEVMFRKVMQVSDDLMWRYYELLTDRSLRKSRKCGPRCTDGRQGGARQDRGNGFPSAVDAMPPPRCSMPWCRPQGGSYRCPTTPMPDACAMEAAFAWTNCWRASGWPNR